MSNEVQGLDKLRKQIGALKKLKFTDATVQGAEIIKEYSKENAPVKTGFLRDSHEVVRTKEGAEVVVNADYAFAVEFGTSKMDAQPFLRPAIDKHKKELLKVVSEEIDDEIAREVKKI